MCADEFEKGLILSSLSYREQTPDGWAEMTN